MVRIPQIFTAALAAAGTTAASAVVDLLPSNFDSIVLQSGKPALVEFFAPWCGHCKTLAPIYDELAASFESKKDRVTIAKVDADEHKELGRRFGVQGFPTLKWFDGKSDVPTDYKSGRDLDSLSSFVTEKTGVKPKGKKAEVSNVDMLTDTTFPQRVGGDKDALIAYTAPWCGHCKTLAPVWETLATDFAAEPSILIGKVDCESPGSKNTAQRAGVKSYPTILYYPAGSSEPVPYTGGRSEADLVTFLNSKTGTHRTPGGGLDSLAGRLPALDELVSALKSGGQSAAEKLEAAVKAGEDKYAEYYGKVAKKASENEGYVEKELGRLQGLLEKGGLKGEKVDDLTRRRNILGVFRGDAATGKGKDEL